MDQFAVVTARMPQYVQQERFDMGSMQVRLFDTKDDATEWAVLNPEYICEVVPVTQVDEVDPDRFGTDDPERPTSSCSCGYEVLWVNGQWEHDAAPSLWGDDHDANADAPDVDDPARRYWDIEDGIVEEDEVDGHLYAGFPSHEALLAHLISEHSGNPETLEGIDHEHLKMTHRMIHKTDPAGD